MAFEEFVGSDQILDIMKIFFDRNLGKNDQAR